MTDDTAPIAASPGFDPSGSVAVVTGATGGIGAALVRALADAGAAVVVATDLDPTHTVAVAELLDAEHPGATILGHGLDVTDRTATTSLVAEVEDSHGPIDLWCANAGIGTASGVDADPALWQRAWEVNVMGHVHAASALLARFRSRRSGHLLVTASAAGLLTNLGDAPYSATKHAAVAFAEWLAITHGHEGIGVTCLCPQGVRTPMVFGEDADEFAALRGQRPATGTDGALDHEHALAVQVVRAQGILEPEDVASCALTALREGRFLALPHPEVSGYERNRVADHDRWIVGMRRVQAHLDDRPGGTGSQ